MLIFKRVLLLFVLFITSFFMSFSQCNPDFIYTSIGLPGVYPPSIQIPNLPVPTGISEGYIGENYNQTITVIILQDTTLDVSSFLPPSAVTAMNFAGISTTMNVGVNHITFDVQNLPNGITYQCSSSNCEYPSGSDGCIKISGFPLEKGIFPFEVNMTINIQIPAISGILSAMSVDIPSFSAQNYDLVINDVTTINELNHISNIYPNPTSSEFTVNVNYPKNISIYNNLMQIVYSKDIINKITINKSELGTGFFIIKISDKDIIEKHKLIIK